MFRSDYRLIARVLGQTLAKHGDKPDYAYGIAIAAVALCEAFAANDSQFNVKKFTDAIDKASGKPEFKS